jgi:TatD DNase family protein
MGAYFSFHTGQLNQYSKKAVAAVQSIPIERILLETDAPETIEKSKNATSYLTRAYELVAELRNMGIELIQEQVEANFRRLFIND